jgi:hypothetical protein
MFRFFARVPGVVRRPSKRRQTGETLPSPVLFFCEQIGGALHGGRRRPPRQARPTLHRPWRPYPRLGEPVPSQPQAGGKISRSGCRPSRFTVNDPDVTGRIFFRGNAIFTVRLGLVPPDFS